ncbi:Rhamnose mutarotase [Mycena kentingensis (nom. inval.)]|nr:Rhamnose mutarotase [Mycena kentingensis (nom. inval.)]
MKVRCADDTGTVARQQLRSFSPTHARQQARLPVGQGGPVAVVSDNIKGLIPALPQLKPEAEKEYREIHAAVWPSVLAALERAHIVDYSIHYYAPLQLLIANFKYVGDDYEGDMQKVADDPETQRWWKVTDIMQESLVEGAVGSGHAIPWWASTEEVFRFEGKA